MALAIGAAAISLASPAAADPRDWIPWCTDDQTPMDNNCRSSPVDTFFSGDAPGANPQVPIGVGTGDPTGS